MKEEQPSPKIFISYRRKDAVAYAGRLNDNLKAQLGGEAVFMDYEAIDPGADFEQVIESSLSNCQIVIVVIGPEWEGRNEDGTRRIDEDGDWVRREVAAVLGRDIPVIPALVGGAPLPERLPEDLAALLRRNAIKLGDADWEDDVKRLVRFMRKALGLTEEGSEEKRVEASGRPPVPRWLKLSGAAAGVVVALLGLMAGIDRWFPGGRVEAKPLAAVEAAAELPLGLIYSMEMDPREGDPYWLRYSVENPSSRPITVHVRGEILPSTPFTGTEVFNQKLLLEPGGKIDNEKVNFAVGAYIKQADFRDAVPVSIKWNIENEHQEELLARDQYTIRFLPRNTLKWDLELPDGEIVPREYTLASLAAWIGHDSKTRDERARAVTAALPPGSRPGTLVELWLDVCFALLFGGEPRIILDPNGRGLIPPGGERQIKTPAEILESGGIVDPLEAVLTVAALASDQLGGARFGMFAFAGEPGSEIDRFLLAWTDVDHQSWWGFDLSRWGKADFETVKTESTEYLRAQLLGDGRVAASLEATGTYYDRDAAIAAVEFETARREFEIYPLP